MPVWIKMGINKKVVPRTHARHQKAVKRVRSKLQKEKNPKMRSVLMSKFGDGMAQLRNKQVGNELPPIAVMPGVHARISNISQDDTWVEDEIITVGQKTIIRKKGESGSRCYEKMEKTQVSATRSGIISCADAAASCMER